MTTIPEAAIEAAAWPEAVSDGLISRCCDCDTIPPFDYRVTDEFWNANVPVRGERVGVICLPCMDQRCDGVGLAAALIEVQWTGRGHTVVLRPTARYEYGVTR